jgi:hypothetical protein
MNLLINLVIKLKAQVAVKENNEIIVVHSTSDVIAQTN